ncbi:hypothetical protein VPH35_086760 [Triticum aestivum]|uniref:uncharacterized protein n=1 Tax=Triticum aestivum TaxID=4565 RepID=UPI001D024DE6|nr:uncharacterized protein LOC123105843 [Triticum aestivum]
MVRTTTTTGNREVMPVIQMALVDERRCCNAPTRPWPPYSSAGGGAAMERSTPAAELQWSCSAQAADLQWSARRRRRSSNGALDAGGRAAMEPLGAGGGAAMEPLGVGGGASMERSTPATELQWSSSAQVAELQ